MTSAKNNPALQFLESISFGVREYESDEGFTLHLQATEAARLEWSPRPAEPNGCSIHGRIAALTIRV